MGFRENLRYLRQRNHWTQEQLGDLLRKSRVTVTKWETGDNEPLMGTVKELADLFGVTTDELIGDALPGTPTDDMAHGEGERRLLRLYRQLNDEGQAHLLDLADTFAASGKYRRSLGDVATVQTA